MRVLITGVGGFVGRSLARYLRSRTDVELFGGDVAAPATVSAVCDEFRRFDLRDRRDVYDLVAWSRPEWVFHLAGALAGEPAEVLRTNTLGSLLLFEAVLTHCPGAKVVVAGSAAEYGPVGGEQLPLVETHACRPVRIYGISKLATTLLALSYHRTQGLRVVVPRAFNVVGPGVSGELVVGAVIGRIREALASGAKGFRVGNLRSRRDFLDVRDLVAAYVRLLEGDLAGEIFNVCSGRGVAVEKVVRDLVEISGSGLATVFDPALVEATDVDCVYGSYAKAHAAIGFEPTVPLEESLKAAWDHTQREHQV